MKVILLVETTECRQPSDNHHFMFIAPQTKLDLT
jgi:hypothetical protein